MQSSLQEQFIRFLKDELAVPVGAIALALRHPEQTVNVLPMILWQYGLINLEQLEKIFDWLETV